jgi:site-specific recombinase XerD
LSLTYLLLATPTQKLHLAALRRFFDRLVNRHVCVINPAATVKAERYSEVEGKTPEISPDQARTLLKSIAVTNPVGLRDQAILAVLVYTAARVGAVAKLTAKNLIHDGSQYTLRFSEKGGKSREIPPCDTTWSGSSWSTSKPPTSPRVPSSAPQTEKPRR